MIRASNRAKHHLIGSAIAVFKARYPIWLGLVFLPAASLGALIAQLQWPAILDWWSTPTHGRQTPELFEQADADGRSHARFFCWAYLPDDNVTGRNKSWPLLFFLRGSGERGHNLSPVTRHGRPALVNKSRQFPMIIISPQCPAGIDWQADSLSILIESVMQKFRIHADQICVTGYCMGGYGAYELVAAHPDPFAAIVPVADSGDPKNSNRLKSVSVWAFHDGLDTAVPLANSWSMVDSARMAGASAEFTIFPDKDHAICHAEYGHPDLYR